MDRPSGTLHSAKVSVVIPCYNQGRFLGEAIESAEAQTHPPLEIIVVDDGSTDDTVAVARRYAGVRCVSQRNQGQGAARNTGLGLATGDHIVFLDSDDRLLPNAFDVGLQCLAAHSECAFAAGRCLVFDPQGRRDVIYEPVVEHDHYVRLLLSNYIWMPGTVIFRTAVVRGVGGFKTTVTGAEDYDLYLRIAREHRIWCHDGFVAEYRQHETNISRRAQLMLRSSLTVMYGQRSWLKGDARAMAVWRQGVRNWQKEYGEEVVRAVRKQMRAGEWRRVIPALLMLAQYHPKALLHHASRKLARIARGEKPDVLEEAPQ